MKYFAYLSLLSFLASSCYQPRTGCLDIEAVNFDAAADIDCSDASANVDCRCEYPQWRLRVAPLFNAGVWSPGAAYETPEGQPFRLQSFVFYLSDFTARQNGVDYRVEDTVRVRVFGANPGDTATAVLRTDIALYRFPTLSYALGAFRTLGTFDEVTFRFGLPPAARRVVPGSTPAGHPLRPQSDTLWLGRDAGYLFAEMVVARDSAAGIASDTLQFTAADVGDLFLTGSGSFIHEFATDFPVTFSIDYFELFRGVDFQNTAPAAWKSQIVANLPNAIAITQ